MNILIAAATIDEIAPMLESLQLRPGENVVLQHKITVLITGTGMTATAFAMGAELAINRYDFALNLGIAGSFNRNFALGEVIRINRDCFAELGAENDSEFITIDELGFGRSVFEENTEVLSYPINLPQATGITVNKVHGNENSISAVISRLNPQTESMEGAAFFYSCHKTSTPCAQVRAISNYVEKRNRDNWKIGLAVKNLNIFAATFLKQVPGL